MIIGHVMGGLGNQLFQIFMIISLSIDANTQFFFPDKEQLCSIRHAYWNSFLSRLRIFLQTEQFIKFQISKIIREEGFEYQNFDIELVKTENLYFYGYFQSYKYFEKNYKIIYDLIDIDKYKNELIHKISCVNVLKNVTELIRTDNDLSIYNKTISMHFRLGDYKNTQNCHPLMTLKYYSNCLKYLNDSGINLREYKILYFCENNLSDIRHVITIINDLQFEYPYLEFVRQTGLEDYEEMILMSLCKHNIIANSTFSWWGAYFNNNEDKIIMYPNVWFGPGLGDKNIKDLHPQSWIKISIN
jgi:hypothetical protein